MSKKKVVTLCVVLFLLCGCADMPEDATERPKPKYEVTDVLYLKLEPSQAVQVLERSWYSESGWKYRVRCWEVRNKNFHKTTHHVCEYELTPPSRTPQLDNPQI